MRPEVDGPVRERAVLVNKNTDKLSTVESRHVKKINILRYVDSRYTDCLFIECLLLYPTLDLDERSDSCNDKAGDGHQGQVWVEENRQDLLLPHSSSSVIKLAMDTTARFGFKRSRQEGSLTSSCDICQPCPGEKEPCCYVQMNQELNKDMDILFLQ